MSVFYQKIKMFKTVGAIWAYCLWFGSYGQINSTATQLADQMTVGWNIGNSLEVPGNETGWGNPPTTQQLIDAVHSAGFNTIRIPCAWDSYANQSTHQIDPAWLARVREVVDYCYANNMYVILNSHWDGGWLEEHPFYSHQVAVNQKQDAYWTQIANYFIGYDEHLLFAGTNEVRADYGTPTAEYIEVQESYNQTFVDAVRATGGNNATRSLIVQTYNTNAWHGLNYFSLPNDPANDRMFVEIHHYDPYDFTLNANTAQACTVWGQPWSGGDVCSWGQENYVEDLFGQMKARWVDNGIPVLIGEYGVAKRTSLSGTAYSDHIASREYYLEYVTDAARRNGFVGVYWDNGYNGDMGFALFDRNSGGVVDQGVIDALMRGAGVNQGTYYNLSTSTIGSGSVSASPGGASHSAGTVVTLTANAAAGWQFDGWSGDVTGTANPVSVTMDGHKSITSNFSEITTGNPCASPTTISLPYSHDGAGEHCWVVSGNVSYLNSWNLDQLEINGVDYTNRWANSLPPKDQGKYYIQYRSSVPWGHFEIHKKGNGRQASEAFLAGDEPIVYPNPFTDQVTVELSGSVNIVLCDVSGKVLSQVHGPIGTELKIGEDLEPGIYLLKLVKADGSQMGIKIVKQ